jgi:uncharacterized Zn-binding protein involved in type VI secretion
LQCRVGDPGSHGGSIITGAPDFFDDGKAVARLNDSYACPIHGVQPIIQASPDYFCNGRGVVRHGDQAACGATMIGQSPTTWIN